jgi:hypothetical protein
MCMLSAYWSDSYKEFKRDRLLIYVWKSVSANSFHYLEQQANESVYGGVNNSFVR